MDFTKNTQEMIEEYSIFHTKISNYLSENFSQIDLSERMKALIILREIEKITQYLSLDNGLSPGASLEIRDATEEAAEEEEPVIEVELEKAIEKLEFCLQSLIRLKVNLI